MYIKYATIYFGYVLLSEVKATETHTTELKRLLADVKATEWHTTELKRLLHHFLKSSKTTFRRLAVKKTSFQIPVIPQRVTSQKEPHWRKFAAYASSFDQLHKIALKKGQMRSPLVYQMARDVQLMKRVVRRMKDHHAISSVISIPRRMKGYAPSSGVSKPIFKTSEFKTTGSTPSPLRKIFLEHYDILTKIAEEPSDSN